MLTPFLLLSSLIVAGWGCGPAMAACEPLHAAPPALVRTIDDPLLELARALSSPKVADRKRALKSLAADGSPPAWRQAFVALADPESEVGDEAQMLLARIEDLAVASELAGRAGLAHKDLAMRLRAAEGLGRVKCSVDVGLLLRALDDREHEVAHLALWSIERLANAQRLSGDVERAGSALEQAARTHRDGYVRAAAICARAALSARGSRDDSGSNTGEFVQFLARAAQDRDPRVRCAAAMATRGLPQPQSASLLPPFERDPALAVRLARIEALEAQACKPGVLSLIATFETETAARGRREIVASLQRLSGLLHRGDPRPWRDWAATLPDDWRPVLMPISRDSEEHGQRAGGGGEAAHTSAQVNFAGMPLVSQHVCFAIDFSGSMWTPMPDGRLPKELVDARLRATLESLTPATEFNIVPFTNEVLPWRPKLVPANPANVRTAIADFEKCNSRGRGNFFDAAVFGLDDPEVDTLLTLTDGVPTGGFHSNMELVVALLLERNRFRRVAFDTVLVDAPPHAERRWRILSQHSGGRLVATEKAE